VCLGERRAISGKRFGSLFTSEHNPYRARRALQAAPNFYVRRNAASLIISV
jgi:hypothetical protein